MSIIYQNPTPRDRSGSPPRVRVDPTVMYLQHFANQVVLMHLAQFHPDRDIRLQALDEIEVAEKKMAHWSTRWGYDQEAAVRGCASIKSSFHNIGK